MGTLYLVATPIGNLEDITIRAIKTLFSVDYIACEDTRRTGQLIKYLESSIKYLGLKDIKKPQFISYYDEVETKRIPEIIDLLALGKNIALVSDSGTPLIADPGYKLVKECFKRKIKVISIPGPSSILTALTSSGLPTNQFLFLGYLPASAQKRLNILKELFQLLYHPDSVSDGRRISRFFAPLRMTINIHPTIVFFESPHRLNETLTDLEQVFGDIEIVVARELTKIYEEIWRGKISEALFHFTNPKGEFVFLFNILQE